MKTKVKEIASIIFTFTERMMGIKPPKVTILLLHSISDDGTLIDVKKSNFSYQINYLKENFDFITLDQVVKFIKGDFIPHNPSVALTFDDGYEDILKNVIPILTKYSIPATFFVVAEPENVRRTELKNRKAILSLKDIKKIDKNLFTIGSHTLTHIDLSNSSIDLSFKEIRDSKQILENLLNREVDYLAYPKGFYNDEVVKKAAGVYKASLTSDPGIINYKSNLQLLNRIGVDRTITNVVFPSLFTHWIVFYFNLKYLFFSSFRFMEELINSRSEHATYPSTK